MITEDYVSFETAKLLKEKGFDNISSIMYKENGEICINPKSVVSWRLKYWYPCLTLQMACKWLMEKHKLYIEDYVVKNYSKKKLGYTYSIQNLNFTGSDDEIESCNSWDTPSDAIEAALQYVLKNLIE